MKFLRFIVPAMAFLALVSGVSAYAIVRYTNRFAAPYEFSNVRTDPSKPVAIVFGSLVYPDHTLCPILADRVDAAIALYKMHKVSKILMSGDNSEKYDDEPTAMRAYAVARGVLAAAIQLDYAGFDTYDSCYRAIQVFNIQHAILVTQRYHVHRAITIARTLGMDAFGIDLPDWSKYPQLRKPLMRREYASDVKAWWELHITHRKPHFLGTKIPIE